MDKIIKDFPDSLRTKVISTPGTAKLYEISNNTPKLNLEKKMKFHRIVAQLLYIEKKTRPGTCSTFHDHQSFRS